MGGGLPGSVFDHFATHCRQAGDQATIIGQNYLHDQVGQAGRSQKSSRSNHHSPCDGHILRIDPLNAKLHINFIVLNLVITSKNMKFTFKPLNRLKVL
ncbi:hypothetical protein DL347_20065 [Pseudomonas fluorescens]|uniref:Uncharacterized protein n=1 Tax=Pseudomonas fluorescens TaxID=294 RepID=A0A7Z6MVE4_PSEFL|nr:hypothetical protein DL347_20065 [Pseudomonas fluorescens]